MLCVTGVYLRDISNKTISTGFAFECESSERLLFLFKRTVIGQTTEVKRIPLISLNNYSLYKPTTSNISAFSGILSEFANICETKRSYF